MVKEGKDLHLDFELRMKQSTEQFKVTANTTTDHQNRSRGVTFEKQKENSQQFLSYDHVTNGLALIMKDKAETTNLLQMKERKNCQKMPDD